MKKSEVTIPNYIIIGLILVAALSRLLPHQPNFTPIGAIAIFAGVFLRGKYIFVLPILALLISDYILGFYNGMIWVYSSFISVGLIGIWIKYKYNFTRVSVGTISSSILFFVVTNFGVWLNGSIYPQNLQGLVSCYVAAIPFFRNSFSGDIVYVTVLFGSYELICRKYFVKLASDTI